MLVFVFKVCLCMKYIESAQAVKDNKPTIKPFRKHVGM